MFEGRRNKMLGLAAEVTKVINESLIEVDVRGVKLTVSRDTLPVIRKGDFILVNPVIRKINKNMAEEINGLWRQLLGDDCLYSKTIN
jgi:hydrogenase maturation factor